MTDADRMEALLDLVDDTRSPSRERSESLVVFGYAERRGKNSFRPTTAGWNFLGARGRPFDR